MALFAAVIGQFYRGTGTGSGLSTNKTAFLAANPGLTLQDFEGIAPTNGTAAAPTFAGFTQSGTGSVLIADKGYWGTVTPPHAAGPFASMGANSFAVTLTMTINLSPAVSAVGFNWASVSVAPVFPGHIQFWSGVTLLHEEVYPPSVKAPGPNVFTGFLGYAPS